jgi:ABC-type sugar transport system substrate-binding protein
MTRLRWIALLLAAIGALSIAGCGGDDTSAGDGSASSGPAASGSASSTPEPASGGEAAAPDVKFEGSPEVGLPTGYDEPKPAKLRVAFLMALGANEFIGSVGKAFQAEAEKLGGEALLLDAKLDANTQVSQFEQLLAQGIDGVMINALDPKALAPLLKRAKAKGVPVIGIDATDDPNAIGDLTSQLWQRREEQAYLQVRELRKHLEDGAKIGQITLSLPISVVQVFIQHEKKWAPKFGLEIVGNADNNKDDIAGGEAAATGLFAKHPEIEGILPYNDPSGIGAASAARAAGKKDIPIVGTNGGSDALTAIKAGRLLATVKIDAVGLGKYGAWGLYDAKQGAKLPPTALIGEPEVVTTDTVDGVKSWADQIAADYGG